jgi:hypothetical protein
MLLLYAPYMAVDKQAGAFPKKPEAVACEGLYEPQRGLRYQSLAATSRGGHVYGWAITQDVSARRRLGVFACWTIYLKIPLTRQ